VGEAEGAEEAEEAEEAKKRVEHLHRLGINFQANRSNHLKMIEKFL